MKGLAEQTKKNCRILYVIAVLWMKLHPALTTRKNPVEVYF